MPITRESVDVAEASFRLGEWVVEPQLNRLSRDDQSLQIELRMMDVLVCLARHSGDLVTRRHLIDTVWATEYITEKTLTGAVAKLRRVLGDDVRQPRYIETIHGKGYRLIADLDVVEDRMAKVAPFPERLPRRVEDARPYPGLAPFTEDQAEFFFGREADVFRLWRLITARRLHAVIGASGIGKTSLLRAGLIPTAPDGWHTLQISPGESPFRALGRALIPVFAQDEHATAELLDIENVDHAVAIVSRWRVRHQQALLIIDQFEELFTLSSPQVQASFAELLGRLARDVDVHVLLSMRDDFLVRSHALPPMQPIFEQLTVLDQLHRAALRRALELPADRLGFSFENGLVDEMLEEVAEERAALPILAFAAARLWEMRDRDRRLLTRQSYEEIGRVGGALASHAERTLQAIGSDRTALVRELFRNLVTAEGTRAVREWANLLSVFPDSQRESGAAVLRSLIDARMLTSYEVREEDHEPNRRVEIIHESLLTNWPRLVGWRTQDADAARLRDELRQAARTWEEHERPDDLLWTGAVYREFTVWRERYSGQLSATERAFADEMTRHAKHRKRRRRTLVAATIVVLLGLLAIIGGLWQRSRAQARRAEAANLFSLGQLHLEDHPSATVAYAAASLRLADSPQVRRMVLEALWKGPTEIRLPTPSFYWLEFSPDGSWLASVDPQNGVELWPADGGPPTRLEGNDSSREVRFNPTGDLLAASIGSERREVGIWSLPDGQLVRRIPFGDAGSTFCFVFSRDGRWLITSTQIVGRKSNELVVRSWPVSGGEPEVLARISTDRSTEYIFPDLDPTNSRFAWPDGREVRVAPFEVARLETSSAVPVEHDRTVTDLIFGPRGRQLATMDVEGVIRLWSLEKARPRVTRSFHLETRPGLPDLVFDRTGSKLMAPGGRLLDLGSPPDAEPLRLRRPGDFRFGMTFGPNDDLVAISVDDSVSLWPLTRRYPRIVRLREGLAGGLAFTPDGRWLLSTSGGTVRLWPLDGLCGEGCRILDRFEGAFVGPMSLAMAPDGSFVVVGTVSGQVKVLPLDGSPDRQFDAFTDNVCAVAVDHRSRLVAAGSGAFVRENATVYVWNVRSGEEHVLDAGDGAPIRHLEFSQSGDLWALSWPMLRRWQLEGGEAQIVEQIDLSAPPYAADGLCDLDADSRQVLLWQGDDRIWLENLESHDSWEFEVEGPGGWCSLDPTGTIALIADEPGLIRVSRIGAGHTHWLPGRTGGDIVVSPDGRWVASGGEGNAIVLWPMPDLDGPPLHTLPRGELIAKLESLTNLRVVEDSESPTGWRLGVGPFPGWETLPTW